MKKPLFTKKGIKPAEEKVTETALQEERKEIVEEEVVSEKQEEADTAQEQASAPVIDSDSDDSGTVRLSCDLPRKHHRALRIAAANCDRSITDMLETLLECHIVHCQIPSIVAAYHKNSVKCIRIK